jgi:hypothetical protein
MTDGDPAVSSVEVFGFLYWISSAVAFGELIISSHACSLNHIYAQINHEKSFFNDAVLYVLWAFTPSSVLEWHGITYYPSKYWAVAIPTWVCVTVIALYWIYER